MNPKPCTPKKSLERTQQKKDLSRGRTEIFAKILSESASHFCQTQCKTLKGSSKSIISQKPLYIPIIITQMHKKRTNRFAFGARHRTLEDAAEHFVDNRRRLCVGVGRLAAGVLSGVYEKNGATRSVMRLENTKMGEQLRTE